jgi:hypothetical protein
MTLTGPTMAGQETSGAPRPVAATGRAVPQTPFPWQAHILAAVLDVEHDRDRWDHGRIGPGREVRAIDDALGQAWAIAAEEPRRFRFLKRFNSGRIDLAYRHLHAAECMVAAILPDDEIAARAPELLSKYRKCLDGENDARLALAERALAGGTSKPRGRPISRLVDHVLRRGNPPSEQPQTTPTATAMSDDPGATANSTQGNGGAGPQPARVPRAAVYSAVLRSTYDILDEKHAALHRLRTALYIGTFVLTLVVAAFCALTWLNPELVPLCFTPAPEPITAPQQVVCPSTSGVEPLGPASWDVSLVAVVGLLGASLSSAIWVSRLPPSPNSNTVAYALAFFKLPVGALSAVAGLLVIHGQFIPGLSELDTQPQILAYAFVFGFAQQLITGVLDRQAGEMISKIPDKSTPSKSSVLIVRDEAAVHPPAESAAQQLAREID